MQTSDKVVLEQYNLEELDDPATQLVGHFVNPGQEIGGDARLVMPPERSIQSGTSEIDGGVKPLLLSLLMNLILYGTPA